MYFFFLATNKNWEPINSFGRNILVRYIEKLFSWNKKNIINQTFD